MIQSMSDSPAPDPAETPSKGPGTPTHGRTRTPVWLRRTIVGVAIAVALVAAFFIVSATVPLTWANAIKSQVGPQLGNSIPLGMFYGFTFSFIPVLLAWQAHHKNLHTWLRISILAVAALLTLPNLLTLSVLHGTTTSARNALAIWNTGGANWFGAWSQGFMVAGIVCAITVIILSRIWLHRGKKIRQIKAAEKLVRDNDTAKARAAKEAARAAEKSARIAERAARRQEGRPKPPADGAAADGPKPPAP